MPITSFDLDKSHQARRLVFDLKWISAHKKRLRKKASFSKNCFANRFSFKAFEWHWQNPADEFEKAPYIPECEPGENGFETKQCQTVWDDKRNKGF